MTQLINDLIVITAGMSDDPATTIQKLKTYYMNAIMTAKIETYAAIMDKVKNMALDGITDDELKTDILTGSPRAFPDRLNAETTPERMEGE